MQVTERMVSDFKEHIVWRELTKDAEERISALRDELTTLDPVRNVVEVCRNQGRIDGMLFIIGAPDDYAMESKVKKIEIEENKKEEEI